MNVNGMKEVVMQKAKALVVILFAVVLLLIISIAAWQFSKPLSAAKTDVSKSAKTYSYRSAPDSSRSYYSMQKKTVPPDELVVDTDGKSIYKVYASSSEIHFTGTFDGPGHFSITMLDSNQDHYKLVANEIGSYRVDKSVRVTAGSMYYIEIECTRGSWTVSWTGTGTTYRD